MSAFAVLRAYLDARASFTDDEFAWLRTCFVSKALGAGDLLQRAGDVASHAAFVTRGCLRSYVIDARGKEHVVQFAPETWWLADGRSLISGAPSQYFVDAIEDSEVLLITAAAHQEAVARVPGFAEAHRLGLQRHNAAKDQRITTSLTASAEDRYLEFLDTYPSIAQRVPQFMLASYLGVTPETLSRIRKHRSRR